MEGAGANQSSALGGGEAKSWETASFSLSVGSPSREGGSRAWHRGLCCPYGERQLRLLRLLEITPISWRNQCDKEHAKSQNMRLGQSKSQRGNRKEKNIKTKKKSYLIHVSSEFYHHRNQLLRALVTQPVNKSSLWPLAGRVETPLMWEEKERSHLQGAEAVSSGIKR